jgi:hypothetical protein
MRRAFNLKRYRMFAKKLSFYNVLRLVLQVKLVPPGIGSLAFADPVRTCRLVFEGKGESDV